MRQKKEEVTRDNRNVREGAAERQEWNVCTRFNFSAMDGRRDGGTDKRTDWRTDGQGCGKEQGFQLHKSDAGSKGGDV